MLLGPDDGHELPGCDEKTVEQVLGAGLQECVVDGGAMRLAELEALESGEQCRW